MEIATRALNGGHKIARTLRDLGVKHIFCVPGESYLELMDGLYDVRDQLDLISCRHEHGAAHMAEAYGKLSNQPGVCLVTRGPGACNGSIGVHTAFQDSTPMLYLIGQVPTNHMGREAFQEVDYQAMFGPLAKSVFDMRLEDDPEDTIREAWAEALSGRPGPVVVTLPEDVLSALSPVPVADDGRPHLQSPPSPRPEPIDLSAISGAMNAARQPVVLLGGGGWSAEARADITRFIEANALPIACGFRRHDLFDNNNPHYIGDLGIGPNPQLLAKIRAADLLIVIGARLGEMTSQGYKLFDEKNPDQKLIHLHADAGELGKVFKPHIGMSGPIPKLAKALSEIEVQGPWQDWLFEARAAFEAWQKPEQEAGILNLAQCMLTLDQVLTDDAIVTVDAGNFSGWPQRYLRFGGKRRLLGPTSGAMGYGVPAAVAAQIREPDRMVIGCTGDGSFGMTGNELLTARQYNVRPIIIVFNNIMYGTIRMHQDMRHPGRAFATDLLNPDYASLAQACDCFGQSVENTEAFAPAIAEALAQDKPALIEMRMNPDQITTRATLSQLSGRQG